MVSFHCKFSIAYFIIWNLVYTIYLLEFNIFTLYMWLTCQVANMHSYTFTGFIYTKETHFCTTLKLGRLICVIYKFNLTGGLTLLNCLLLLLFDCLSSDFSVHVLQLLTSSSFHWYNFKWLCVFLYMIPSSVLIL